MSKLVFYLICFFLEIFLNFLFCHKNITNLLNSTSVVAFCKICSPKQKFHEVVTLIGGHHAWVCLESDGVNSEISFSFAGLLRACALLMNTAVLRLGVYAVFSSPEHTLGNTFILTLVCRPALSNRIATSQMWLFKLKLIEIKLNLKISYLGALVTC